jgi:hypothetical protein
MVCGPSPTEHRRATKEYAEGYRRTVWGTGHTPTAEAWGEMFPGLKGAQWAGQSGRKGMKAEVEWGRTRRSRPVSLATPRRPLLPVP